MNRFNWGAFIFGSLWGLFNGIYWPIIVMVLARIASSFFPAVSMFACGIISLMISLYLGLNGNRIAWDRVDYYSVEKFYASQRRWTIAGIALIAILLVIFIVLALVGVAVKL